MHHTNISEVSEVTIRYMELLERYGKNAVRNTLKLVQIIENDVYWNMHQFLSINNLHQTF